ncbi:hypothetical protein CHS0354_025422 [Potamilus streckersoni]|nr:hypothetical protein CHS0354_025422 [Potamilus streckersoni]
MIQLLSDLNIHGDAQSKLHMLKKEDIDINFRETEIRVFQKMVSGLVSYLTVVKGDMTSLQNSQSDLSQDMEQVRDSTMETTGKVDTVEADIESMRKSQEELKIIYDKMVSFFDKNPGILDKEITETMRIIGMDVQDLQSNLSRVETELQALKGRVIALEKHCEETKIKIEGIERKFAAFEIQNKNDEQLSLQREAPRRKRPESDGLIQLKYQTEDKLDTLGRLGCIPTTQAEEAKKLLEGKRSVVIKGNPGEGKTTMALHLIDNEMYRDRCVVLDNAQDWKTVDTHHVDIVVLDDVFGKYDLDPGRLQEWMVHLPTIQEHVDAGKLRVIITTRVDILSKAYSRLGSLKLFSEDLSLTLSSEQLTNSEKMSILKRELHRHKRTMYEDEKEKCIAYFSGLIGFPQCCSLFAADSKSFNKGPEFFRFPEKIFVANITELGATRFLSLAFLFCNGGILEEHLSPETMPNSSKHLLMELASYLSISEKEASITLLRDVYDNFLEMYVMKSMLSYIQFTHATVSEAVGHVLGDRCLEMVIQYGDSEYLYQRTYTADAKDCNSQNVFIPVSVYGLLAQRMVYDVIYKGLVENVVRHSALKQNSFLIKLKCELRKGNVMKDFFTSVVAGSCIVSGYERYLLEGKCMTFMQYTLQSDDNVVKLVYSQLLELLACAHKNNSSDCWQCGEKQMLLELALYYNHFHIVDKLITMEACYTPVSLCNAARHGDRRRVQTILETLKRSQVFKPKSKEARYALCRAYISGNQNLIEFLLKEGIILDCWHVKSAVQHGNMNSLMKVVEHLKCHNKWNPDEDQDRTDKISWDFFWLIMHFVDSDPEVQSKIPYTRALYIAYIKEEFDKADYLLKNEVKVSHDLLVYVSISGSQKAVAKVIQDLKVSGTWDPHCDGAYEALEKAYSQQKYDVYDLLVRDGVSLKMKNLPGVIIGARISLESIKKAIQYLKDTDSWDPKCDYASEALGQAYVVQKYDVCDLLVQEGFLLQMKNLSGMVYNASSGFLVTSSISLESMKKAIQLMKDTDSWDPKCDHASETLATACEKRKYDVCDLLVQEGVSLRMRNLPHLMQRSLGCVEMALKQLKGIGNWDPKCDDASKALENAYCYERYNVCDLLVQEGVSLTMKNLPDVVFSSVSLEQVEKVIQHLKDTVNWDPKCDDASKALENAYVHQKYDAYNLLVQEGISLKMKNLPNVLYYSVSMKSVQIIIQDLKDTVNWDPKCDDASQALACAYMRLKYDLCDLLLQEGVSLTMKNLSHLVWSDSLESVKEGIQFLKDTNNWDSKCDDSSEALAVTYILGKYDLCDLLVQEGVTLQMKNLPGVIYSVSWRFQVSLASGKRAIQHLKDTDKWDPKCDDASEALANAYNASKYEVCDLLVQEGVSLRMRNLPRVAEGNQESVKKAIQHLKDTDNWDPRCDNASEALENAYSCQKYDVYNLLEQEGVSLKINNLPGVV